MLGSVFDTNSTTLKHWKSKKLSCLETKLKKTKQQRFVREKRRQTTTWRLSFTRWKNCLISALTRSEPSRLGPGFIWVMMDSTSLVRYRPGTFATATTHHGCHKHNSDVSASQPLSSLSLHQHRDNCYCQECKSPVHDTVSLTKNSLNKEVTIWYESVNWTQDGHTINTPCLKKSRTLRLAP